MSSTSFVLGTLCLNEMEWLSYLYKQHKDWPGLVKWVFVEAADLLYARANPDMVTRDGLSVDGTTEFLEELTRGDPRLIHVKHGLSAHQDPRQGKCSARQRYMDVANSVGPDFVMILDADEFYTREDQQRIAELRGRVRVGAVLKQRHLWKPPFYQSVPGVILFNEEVGGGYWDVPHTRLWKWRQGMRYSDDHNTPDGCKTRLERFDLVVGSPQCCHMGFAACGNMRRAKHLYYRARGEDKSRHHRMYVDCREAWEQWQPGDELPHKARVVQYRGPVPECFK